MPGGARSASALDPGIHVYDAHGDGMAGTAWPSRHEVLSMHRGEKPRQAKTRQPGPHRLAAHADDPRSRPRHRRGRPDCRSATARRRRRAPATRLSAELSLLSPSTNSFPGGTVTSGRVVEPAIVAHLEDRVVDAVRQRLDDSDRPARCRRDRLRLRRCRPASAWRHGR